jgi:hypothetical protein
MWQEHTVYCDLGPNIIPHWNDALGVGMKPSVLERHLGEFTHNTQHTHAHTWHSESVAQNKRYMYGKQQSTKWCGETTT